MKYCPRCKKDKPRTVEFWYRDSKTNDGFQGYCKACKSELHKNYMENPTIGERVRRKIRVWQKGVGNEKYLVARSKYRKSKKFVNLIKEADKACKV